MSVTTTTETENATVKTPETYAVGDVVEGIVVAVDRSVVYVDLSPVGTGIIYGREFSVAKDILRKTHVGDAISAQIIALETPDGYIDLSLKEARKAFIWGEAEASLQSGQVYEVTVKSANRGGLVIEWNGVRGFLPASQLTEEKYPKVLSRDKDSILNELKKFVDTKMMVTIESVDPDNDTIIFSEHKDGVAHKKSEGVSRKQKEDYKVGDVKNGIVTGVVDFGVFVTIDNAVEGLVHISEMDWGLVDDPRKFCTVGNQVQVKIIDVEGDKYSFSFKELHKNPWEEIHERHKVGDTVSGVVIKYGAFGAFASIKAGVSGLVHISNFADENDLRNSLEIGKTYEFVITNLEPREQKLTLVPEDRYRSGAGSGAQTVGGSA
ncbi:MAG: S1 RNA-binding domain-containing protein [Candidatus Kaiserbacteria bacterium]|nr:S1 RNA-binding domain-containing protein [Candidatus Kaiserbacteria bacterium]